MQTIGYFDPSPGASGTTRYLLELLSGLDRSRYRPVVFAHAPAPWHAEAVALGATMVCGSDGPPPALAGPAPTSPARRRQGLLASLRRTVAWLRALRRETAELAALFAKAPVDLLHSNVAGDEVAPIAARQAGVPRVIATLHIDPTYDIFHERAGWLHRRLERKSFRALDVAIAVSKNTADAWGRRLGRTRPAERPSFRIIPNGIRLERMGRRHSVSEAKALLGLPADALVVGSAGRLDWAKGYCDLLAAWPRVLAAIPDAIFVHAGTGPLEEDLRAESVRLGIAGQIRWLGFRSDVRDLLEACDVYAQPSWCETQGLAVLEAGALGVPVVASDAGGMPASLDGGRAGWVVPARDPNALAATLRKALHSPNARAQTGAALQLRVRSEYTHDQMVGATSALYDELLQRSPRK